MGTFQWLSISGFQNQTKDELKCLSWNVGGSKDGGHELIQRSKFNVAAQQLLDKELQKFDVELGDCVYFRWRWRVDEDVGLKSNIITVHQYSHHDLSLDVFWGWHKMSKLIAFHWRIEDGDWSHLIWWLIANAAQIDGGWKLNANRRFGMWWGRDYRFLFPLESSSDFQAGWRIPVRWRFLAILSQIVSSSSLIP